MRERGGWTYVVEVNEIHVNANRGGATWWAMYCLRFRDTGRITEVVVTLGGAVCHVACDDREHADQLAAHMVEHGGLPKSAVKVRRVRPPGKAPP